MWRQELDTALQVWPDRCWLEWDDPISISAGSAPVDAAQDMFHLCCYTAKSSAACCPPGPRSLSARLFPSHRSWCGIHSHQWATLILQDRPLGHKVSFFCHFHFYSRGTLINSTHSASPCQLTLITFKIKYHELFLYFNYNFNGKVVLVILLPLLFTLSHSLWCTLQMSVSFISFPTLIFCMLFLQIWLSTLITHCYNEKQ